MNKALLFAFVLTLAGCPGAQPACDTAAGGACSTLSTNSSMGGGPSTTTSSSSTSVPSSTNSTSATTTMHDGGGGAPAMAHVTLRVLDGAGEPIAGAAVVVNDADGKVVDMLAAGSDGKSAVDVPTGGSIAVYHAFGLSFVGAAVVDPSDGSSARLVLRGPLALPPTTIPTTQFVESVSQVPAATRVLDVFTCNPVQKTTFGSAPAGATYALTNTACTSHATSSFLTIASNALAAPVAWGATFDLAAAPGGSQAVQVPLTHTNFDSLIAAVTSIPPGVTLVSASLSPQAAATSPIAYNLVQSGSGSAQTFAGAFTVPQGIFRSYQVTERVDFYSGVGESHLTRQRAYANLPATTSFAANAMALVSADPLDVTDPTHPLATWAISEGPRGDHAKVTLNWMSGTATHTFAAFLPPDHGAAFRLPDLPTELTSFAPSATSTFSNVAVEYTDEETITGYAQSSVFHDGPVIDGSGLVKSGSTEFTHVP